MKKWLLFVVFFSPLAYSADLLDALDSAKAYDARYLAALAKSSVEIEKRKQARALLLPTLVGGADLSNTDTERRFDDRPIETQNSDLTNTTYSLAASYLLYDAENYNSSKILGEAAEIEDLLFQREHQSLILRVAKSYFDYLTYSEKLNTVHVQRESVSEQLRQAKKLFELGIVSINDLYEAQATYDRILSDEIQARNDLSIRRDRFRTITGVTSDLVSSIKTSQEPIALPEQMLNHWQTIAQENNLDILIQKSTARTSDLEMNKYKLQASPKVSVNLGYQHSSDDYNSIPESLTEEGVVVGLNLSVPLFTGGYRSSKYRELRSVYESEKQLLMAARRDADLEVGNAFVRVNSGASRYKALQQLVKSSETLLHGTETSRSEGLRTTSDVLRANESYFNARFELAATYYAYLYDQLALLFSVGALSEKDIIQMNSLFH
jgi:outer membrane protein